MTKVVGIAILIVLALGLVRLADRLGLLRPDTRRWEAWLYFTCYGVVVVTALAVVIYGPRVFLAHRFLAGLVLGGALMGAVAGFQARFINRHRPR